MIVFENGAWQSNSLYPNTNFLEGSESKQPKWVIPDGTELAEKIKNTRKWEPIEDKNGDLTDIMAVPTPEDETVAEEKIKELKAQLEEIDRQAIRPLRAIAAGTATDEDREMLAALEQQAEEIRAELARLEDTENSGGTD